jgi:putative membrane protein
VSNYSTISSKLTLILKGIAMGTANKVPGVSGGIVAFVMGFYEEFIASLQKFNRPGFKLLFSGQFSAFYTHTNGQFLSLLFLGMIISYFSVSKVLDFLIVKYELFVWSVFFGMIIGSVLYIFNDFKTWNWKTIGMITLGMLMGVGLSFLTPATENDNLWFVFFCGIISITGMTLPGFSGSFILMLLGNYVLLLVDAVNALFDTIVWISTGDFDSVKNEQNTKMLKILAVFTLGSVTGLVSLSHLLNHVLKHFKAITLALIMGFITGSLGVVWPWKYTLHKTNAKGGVVLDSSGKKIIENYQRYFPDFTSETLYALLFIVLGIGIVLGLEWYGNQNRKA